MANRAHTAVVASAYGSCVTTVLVVEPNEPLRAVLLSRFQREGFRLREAPNAEQGIALARAERPDLIVLDASLKTEDGLLLHEALRADEALADVPLILLTARVRVDGWNVEASSEESAEAKRLNHPFRPNQLLEMARVLVRPSRFSTES